MILFTADIHIKIGAKNIPRAWAIDRYKMFIEQVREVEKNCSLHIMGGDIFDRTPNLEELEVYFRLIEGATIPTIGYDGNHEATKKNNTFFNSLSSVSKALNDKVEIVTTTKEYDRFSILPYADLHQPNSIEKCNKSKALFTHVRGEIPPHVKPEVDLDRFKDFPIVYAGDLHSHSNCQRNIVYPGSPMTTSFHRSLVETGYLLIDENDLTKWTWHPFELPQLIRKTVTDPADMIETDYHRTIYELEGDMKELGAANVVNKDLLDKKIVKRNTESQLNLVDLSIHDEIHLYLEKILGLSAADIKEALGEFDAIYEQA